MLPAKSETELKQRMANMKPGDWICPCGATIMKEFTLWCPYCNNVPSSVPWLAGSHGEKKCNKRNKNRKKGIKRVCQHCGVTFIAKRSDAKFHSNACRMAHSRSNK